MMKRYFEVQPLAKAVAALVGSLGMTALADTQQDIGLVGNEEIQTVQVWGTTVKASSVYMDNETIAIKQADHLSDLLRTIPGIDVGGAHSLNQRITIRGMDDKDLDITIDGARQNNYMYHHMGNLQIHADILKSVDIEVGTNSVINGGLGGAVRFETKDAKHLLADGETWGARVQGTYADNASESLALTAFGQITDTLDTLIYYNYVDRDNYEVGGGEITDGDGNVIPGTDGTVRGLAGELEDALFKLGWDVTESQRLELGYETYADEGDYSYRPDMGLATDIAIAGDNFPLTYPTEFTRDTFTFNYGVEIADNTSISATVYQNESSLWRDETGVYDGYRAVVTGDAKNNGLNVIGTTFLDGASAGGLTHDLSYGGEYVKYETSYDLDSAHPMYVSEQSGEEQTLSSLFVQDRMALGETGIALIPGLRWDQADLDANVTQQTYDDVTYAFAAEYQAIDSLLFKVSTTELFQAPQIGEVFTGAGIRDDENPDLKAQGGTNNEVSVAYQDAVLGADNFSAGFTYFNTNIEDFIYQYAQTGPGPRDFGWDNVGDMDVDGYEVYVGYDLGGFRSLLTYSESDSELSADDQHADLDGARMDRTQGDTISLALDYTFAHLDLTLHWDSMFVDDLPAGNVLDSATLNNAKAGYDVSNVSVRWTPQGDLQGLELTFGIDNVFDEYYASQSSRTGVSFHPRFGELHLTDYEPGRNIKLTAAFQF